VNRYLFSYSGGLMNSSVIPQVQAVFPQGALTKRIKVGLQVSSISNNESMQLL
jgi:hypothetical protein